MIGKRKNDLKICFYLEDANVKNAVILSCENTQCQMFIKQRAGSLHLRGQTQTAKKSTGQPQSGY